MKINGPDDPSPSGSGKRHEELHSLPGEQPQAETKRAMDTPVPTLLRAALEHHQAGRLPQAEALYQQILAAAPAHPDALHLSGLIAHQTGKHDLAVAQISKAIRAHSSSPMYHNNLGLALQAQGKPELAISSFLQAISLKPDFAEAHYNLGNIFCALSKPEEEIRAYRKALAFKPGYAEAHSNLGAALQARDDLEGAIGHYRLALALKPDSAIAHSNLGNALKAQGKPEAACASYRKALTLKPDYAEAHNNLGLALQDLGLPFEAIASFRHALQLKADFVAAHNNLGVTLLSCGALHDGWREYEWRLNYQYGNAYLPDPRDPSRVLPRPSTLLPLELKGKRILFVADQGIGDELCFLRFAHIARQRGAWTAYRPSAKIATLLQRAPGLDAVIGATDIPPDLDQIFSVGDLPLILGVDNPADIPPALPLTPLAERVAAIRHRLSAFGDAPLLGVTWRAGVEKSVGGPASLFKETDIQLLGRALAAWPGEILILQRNPRTEEIAQFVQALGRPAHDLSELNENLEDMLALLAQLDEYVGVSNTNMHLLAGLGKTARVLIPHPPDWRWMAEGDTSPWFPGFRLYRKGPEGDWSAVFDRLAEDLTRRA